MDNLDDSENNVKVSDSAYSNSCSNSQSRRSLSSKSTHSGSNSSGSSGYGGKQSTSGSSTTLKQLPEKRANEKEGKKKKKQQAQIELVQIQADVEFRLPDPAPVTVEKGETHNAAPPSPASTQPQNGAQRTLEASDQNTDEHPTRCSTPQLSMQIVTAKPSSCEGFSCVISMHDGVVLYMSSSLTTTLGFPKDMWIGRSFIDFVHPLDHSTFASQITNGLAVPKKVNGLQYAGGESLCSVQSPSNSVSTMFCRIRRYRGLEVAFSVKEKTISFMPFILRLSFKNICDEKGLVIYLVIQATPLFSAFKIPNEIVVNATPFVMRHVANGDLQYIDNDAVPFLGYLPQDINGQDVLKLYHPEDLAYMRHVYETIVKQGRATRSRPYRLMAQNGHYIKLETEWSSFINPWSRKLELVIGKHHVIEGPSNPDVFQAPPLEFKNQEEDGDTEELKESIVRILNEVPTKPAELAKQQMTKRCQDLATFMESLIEGQPKVEEELRIDIQENDNSYYERDSVMLGGISPHHDYNDSKSSASTPLSYNQLNFNINLKRYFDSHEDPYKNVGLKNTDGNNATWNGQHEFNRDCMSPKGHDSLEIGSEVSAVFSEKISGLPHEYQPKRLTESLLNKHNSEMEKRFVKKHRENRPLNKEDREKISNENKQKKKDHIIRCVTSYVPTVVDSPITEIQPHGQKRASKQFEADTSAHKQHCTAPRQLRRRHLSTSAPPQPSDAVATVSAPASVWPPFVNGMNPLMSQQLSLVSPMPPVPGFVPMYYVPTAGPTIPCTSGMRPPDTFAAAGRPFQPPVQYMMYGQPVFGSPIMVSPFPVQQNVIHNQFANIQNNVRLTTRDYEESTGFSAAQDSSGSRQSIMKSEEMVDRTDGESSYSSFYSSFFKTESGSADDSGDAKKKQNKNEPFAAPLISDKNNLSNKQTQRRKMEPPWMEHVCVTSELIYKYQVLTKSLDEVLISDKKKLDAVVQPSLVNEQLGQLYVDLQLEGVASRLTLEEGITSSGSSSEENNKRQALNSLAKRTRRKRKYGKLVMIYEEDAPLPPPDELEPKPELEQSTSEVP